MRTSWQLTKPTSREPSLPLPMVLNLVKKKAYVSEIVRKLLKVKSYNSVLLQDSTDSGLTVAHLQNGFFGSQDLTLSVRLGTCLNMAIP